MAKMMTHTEAKRFEISKYKNVFEKPANLQTLMRSLEFAIHKNLEHDAIVVSNLARS